MGRYSACRATARTFPSEPGRDSMVGDGVPGEESGSACGNTPHPQGLNCVQRLDDLHLTQRIAYRSQISKFHLGVLA